MRRLPRRGAVLTSVHLNHQNHRFSNAELSLRMAILVGFNVNFH